MIENIFSGIGVLREYLEENSNIVPKDTAWIFDISTGMTTRLDLDKVSGRLWELSLTGYGVESCRLMLLGPDLNGEQVVVVVIYVSDKPSRIFEKIDAEVLDGIDGISSLVGRIRSRSGKLRYDWDCAEAASVFNIKMLQSWGMLQ